MSTFFLGTGVGAIVGMLYGMWLHLPHIRDLEKIAKSWCARWRESEAERMRLMRRIVEMKIAEAESAEADDIDYC